jgi:hypothetical protein
VPPKSAYERSMFDLHACRLGEEARSNLTTMFFLLLQLHEVGGLAIFNKEELTKFGFKSAKKKLELPEYEDLRHFSGYLYGIFFKNYNMRICTIKKIMNVVDWKDMYFIFIFHFDGYPFFSFQTHTNHRIWSKVRNTS